MNTLAAWQRFLRLQSNQKPLTFAYGVRHSVEAHSYYPEHAHRGLELVFHPTGIGVTHIDQRHTIAFDKGSVVVYPPGRFHDQEIRIKGEDLCVQIVSKHPNPPFPKEHLYLPTFDDPGLSEDFLILSQGNTALTASEQSVLNFRATSALLAVVNHACNSLEKSSVSPAEKYVMEAEQYVRLHFEKIVFLADVAKVVGISSDHLRHLFLKQRGKNLASYINELRIERAKMLLVHSRLPLKQIATLCGFSDEYYFSAVFRRMIRIAPRRYRVKYWQSDSE
jgi:AraC-like DNA-binding protein